MNKSTKRKEINSMDKTGVIKSTMYHYWEKTEGGSIFEVKDWKEVLDKSYSIVKEKSLRETLQLLGLSHLETNDALGIIISKLLIKHNTLEPRRRQKTIEQLALFEGYTKTGRKIKIWE